MKLTAILTVGVLLLTALPSAGQNDSIAVSSEPAPEALREVVIVGYGTQRKINATGAVKTIGDDMLRSRPVTDAVSALQGVVPGLNITNDAGGEPGVALDINIRGVGTIGDGSDSHVLMLIDGMEGDLTSVNPNDIANISVLKDAAAAAIYGSRAPFGVIIVTTKSGRKGTQVTYSGNVRFQTPMNVPHPVDSYTMALMVNDAYRNVGAGPQFSREALDRLLAYQQGLLPYGTEAESPVKWKETFQSWANTNWYDVYLKKVAVSQEHNASVSGGTNKVGYYFSANYLDQSGIYRYADESYSRLALAGKVNVRLSPYVRFTWSTRLTGTDTGRPSGLNSLFYHNLGRRYATEPLWLPNGEYHPKSMMQALTQGGRISNRTRQLYNQANIIVEPLEDWQIHVELNSRLENNPYTRTFLPISVTAPDGQQLPLQVIEGMSALHELRSDGSFRVYPAAGENYNERARTHVNFFSTNIYTDYALTLREQHNFKFLLGFQSEYFKRWGSRRATAEVILPGTSTATPSVDMSTDFKGVWTSVGFFGRINYNYASRYLVEVNMRADGASRFPKYQRWGYFPSVSAGWNIANEAFWEPLYHVCNYLKMRGSYGSLGNQNTESFYPYFQRMATTGGNVVLGGTQATILPVYEPFSTSITWERVENTGWGLDWGFFNSRLQGSVDWFRRTTEDMVGPAEVLPGVYGETAPKTNNAEMRTHGWELELSWRDRIGVDFNYSVSATLSDYKSRVTRYHSSTDKVRGWYQGKELGEIWGYRVAGIARSDKEMNDYLAGHDQSALGSHWGGGDLMYVDVNGDGAVNAGAETLADHGDLCVIGNSTPRLAYSFTIAATWRWIDFRAYFQGIGKRDYFIGNGEDKPYGTASFFGFGGGPWQFSPFVEHLDYYRFAGSELGANYDAYYGRLRTDMNNVHYSDRFVQDASYLRLKNLTIGFTLPKEAGLSRWIRKARLYFAAENLFTFTRLRLFDPEALKPNDGVYDVGAGKSYPQYRTYSVGLELTF